jgi:glycerol-3-phosphate acyltransferase PlsX
MVLPAISSSKWQNRFTTLPNSAVMPTTSILPAFHYENYGGTPVLGVAKPVIIGHGISNAKAFKNMISVAEKMIESDICGKMVELFKS